MIAVAACQHQPRESRDFSIQTLVWVSNFLPISKWQMTLSSEVDRLTTLGMAATVNEGAKGSRRSTVRRTRTELKRTTSLQLPPTASCKEVLSGPRLMYSQEGKTKGGLEGEVVELEGELAAVEERVRQLIHLIEEKMPLYKQVNCSSSVENVF